MSLVRSITLIIRNPYVKQAMLQSLGHVISVIPDHFNVFIIS